jgi:type II secretory pathway component HofQ
MRYTGAVRILVLFLLLFSCAFARPRYISLDYHNADLVYVLKQLGPRLGLNIYVGPEVQGSVTLTAQRVPVDGVLNLVLKMQEGSYAYKKVGNTVVIGSPERLQTLDSVKM